MSGIIKITARQAEVWVYSALACIKVQDNLGITRNLIDTDSECKHKEEMKGQTYNQEQA